LALPLSSFTRQDVATSLGVVRLWTTPREADATRPLVFAVPGILATDADIVALGESLGLIGDLTLMRLPTSREAALSSVAFSDLSGVVGGLLERQFPDRAIVLLGVSSGAVIALGVRAANLARIVALEPPLVSEGLWPVIEPLTAQLRKAPDAAASAFAAEAFGVGEAGAAASDHREVLDALTTPVDVVLGEVPLQPPRELKRFPSLVGEADRRRLAETPGVRLHVAPGAGHNVLGQAPQFVRAVLLEACRRASARLPAERLRLDEPLLEATPLTARRVLHWGPDGAAFAQAFQAQNPLAEVTALGADPAAAPPPDAVFEALVLARLAPAPLLGRLAGALEEGGCLVARWAADPERLRRDLAPHGLIPREAVDAAGTGVVRAQKLAPGQAPAPALHLLTIAYASLLMDVRTRLPIRGLRSDPELKVDYRTPPFELPGLAADAPKVLVLQRPAELDVNVWRPFLAQVIREGWVLVMEYDDYPPLVAEVTGKPSTDADMLRFGYVHAVQTATPPLAAAFAPYNPEIALFPNAAFDVTPFPAEPRPRRVFYGGVLRGAYAVEVARALGPAIARCPETEFVVIGDRAVFDALPTEAKRFHEYMNFEAYLGLMSQCAVSLSPIEALAWRDTKSDAKFLDASRAGVLTIASPTIYDRVIRHGENGFLARDVTEWAPLLEQALTDEPLRARLARNAWDYVRTERMFANQATARRDWYRDLWTRREELNAALMGRVPGLREAVAAG
jgi:glycosyltransferase involved in cell wall biosynthesis